MIRRPHIEDRPQHVFRKVISTLSGLRYRMRARRLGSPGKLYLGVKIFGISMVRDEADVIGLSVLHHLSMGLDRVVVLDNGSTDGTGEILRRLAEVDERLMWTRDDGPFYQSSVVTELAREAYRLGADWVVPFDADEFWWGDDLRRVLAGSRAGTLGARVVTFIQARSQHRPTPEGILTMTRTPAEVVPRPGRGGRELVESNRASFVQMQYPPKRISRPTPGIVIHKGNHRVANAAGAAERCGSIVCFHAPLRSRAQLESRMGRSRRLAETGATEESGSSWHTWRWARLKEQGELDREWAANSYEGERLNVYGCSKEVVVDPRLRDLVAPHLRRLQDLSPFRAR